jgi:hypothetical protein
MNRIVYIVGAVVIIIAVLSFFRTSLSVLRGFEAPVVGILAVATVRFI